MIQHVLEKCLKYLLSIIINGAIHRYYVYKDVWWNPFVGEVVRCGLKERNAAHDPFLWH